MDKFRSRTLENKDAIKGGYKKGEQKLGQMVADIRVKGDVAYHRAMEQLKMGLNI
jgi:hypothetical protein